MRYHPVRVERVHLEAGDVAVCGTFPAAAPILPHLDRERVCFLAPLGSRSDLEWLLRALLHYSNVRHLVVCGDDVKTTGQGLLDLWRQGLDENARLPGARGLLSPDLDATSVETLRQSIRVHDWRGRTSTEVGTGIGDLPVVARTRESHRMRAPNIGERKVFTSRSTTFPVFSSDVGDAWLQLLNLVLRIGSETSIGAGGRVAEALNPVVTIELDAVEEKFPNVFEFNREDFERYCRHFRWSSDGAGHDGGGRLPEFHRLDRLESVCAQVTKASGGGTGTAVLLGPDGRDGREHPAGLLSATFHAAGGQLFGSFVLHRADIYTDWPIMALALIRFQRAVAERVGMPVGNAVFVIHSAYLLEDDWARAERVLAERFKRPLPLQVDPAGIFLFGNDGGRARAMLLDHDASTIFWEEAFSDPEQLSWYIVDVMPWLLPQHIRYVGQECAALMRAIKTGEPYEQG